MDLFALEGDPLEIAPSLIALAVGIFVWVRHRADRRARVFLALAASEMAFGASFLITVFGAPASRLGIAAVDGFVLTAGLVAATLFMHFGLSFPHARPWLKRGNIWPFYAAAVMIGAIPVGAALLGEGAQAAVQNVLDGTLIGVGLLVFIAGLVACLAIYRSYREMTQDERREYRAPVLGVLTGMAAGLLADLLIGLFYVTVYGSARWVIYGVNLFTTAAELLLPLFFFMATVRHRLLERHSQDYVSR